MNHKNCNQLFCQKRRPCLRIKCLLWFHEVMHFFNIFGSGVLYGYYFRRVASISIPFYTFSYNFRQTIIKLKLNYFITKMLVQKKYY